MKYTVKLVDVFQFIGCLSFKKIFNLFLIRFSFLFSNLFKIVYHKGLPFSVSIEPTTTCNLSCSECPSGNKVFSRPTGKINLEFFGKIIDELKNHLVYLTLYFQGEPYLHPAFFELVKIARNNKIYVATSTNAHFLSKKNAEATVASGLNRLIISLDGVDNETYQSYRNGGDFHKVIEGIRNLTEARKEMKAHHPYIILQFIVFATNEHQIEEVKKLGKSLDVDEIQIKTAQIYNFENGNPLIPINEKYSRYKKTAEDKYILKKRSKNSCLRMWQSAVITWDGRVVPCCFDKDAMHVMGKLKTQSFKEIWKSKSYYAFRNRLLQNRKSIDICCNCSE
jgi:radical SAM protein with 4Fe4S-binding SPASM domain